MFFFSLDVGKMARSNPKVRKVLKEVKVLMEEMGVLYAVGKPYPQFQ